MSQNKISVFGCCLFSHAKAITSLRQRFHIRFPLPHILSQDNELMNVPLTQNQSILLLDESIVVFKNDPFIMGLCCVLCILKLNKTNRNIHIVILEYVCTEKSKA